jgi:hypothetical protein
MNHQLKLIILLLLIIPYSSSSSSLTFLDWGQPCTNHSPGSSEFSEECDAGKGLVCSGVACDCTFPHRYSFDQSSGECRRKVGKPCQYVNVSTEEGLTTLKTLPFNLKCAELAECTLLSNSIPNTYAGGVVETDGVSMCICKTGLIPTHNFDACIPPPPKLDFAELSTTSSSRPKIQFRPAFFSN